MFNVYYQYHSIWRLKKMTGRKGARCKVEILHASSYSCKRQYICFFFCEYKDFSCTKACTLKLSWRLDLGLVSFSAFHFLRVSETPRYGRGQEGINFQPANSSVELYNACKGKLQGICLYFYMSTHEYFTSCHVRIGLSFPMTTNAACVKTKD